MTLAYFVVLYKGIYEMTPDVRPTDDIIEDDEAFDRWHKSYMDEVARDFARYKAQRAQPR